MGALPYYPQWPAVRSAIPRRADDEELIARLVAEMTTEEKVGQMIQPELAELTPDDVREYRIGSALNGAGIWPGGDRRAGADAWRKTVAAFRDAAEEAYRDRPFTIPFLWATDAVHGHNNVYGATIFPHNIGLGAAGDPGLIRRIGQATAREVAATGMDWTFAPTVTTPRDRRWGRYYEGYSEDPEIVAAYAREMVLGLQGDAAALRSGRGVLATLKHWVADGATESGADRGTAKCGEDLVRNIHAAGFLTGIEAGAQVVMASFSSWYDPANYDHTPGRPVAYNHKVHGSRYLLTDVLKDRIGFDGIVLSDWDAHAEVAGCDVGHARYAILAGLDVLMVAGRAAWQSVWHDTVAGVRDGEIPLARIDDAVTRILRVKLRTGLFARAADRQLPPAELLGAHRELSREAARASAVLLKNAGGVLPLSRTARVLVAGSGADEIQKQTGGWTLSWQGDDVDLTDLPGGSTVASAVRGVVGDGRTTVDPWLERADPTAHDVAIVVIGEDSYAEMRGTIKPWRSLDYRALKRSYARDTATLRTLRDSGVRVVTILLTGRPLYTTEEINLSDAFVVGWLPGPHAEGLTDLLFEGPHDFQGRLAGSWPRRKDSMAVNRVPAHIPGYTVPPEETAPEGAHTPLFRYGYGLSRTADGDTGLLPVDTTVDTTPAPPAGPPVTVLGADDSFVFRVGGHNTWSRADVPRDEPLELLIVHTAPAGAGGLSLRFNGFPAFVYAQTRDGTINDIRGYGRLAFDVQVVEQPDRPLLLACHDDFPAQPGLELNDLLRDLHGDGWHPVDLPLRELAALGTDLRHVDVPFMLYTDGRAHLRIANVRLLP